MTISYHMQIATLWLFRTGSEKDTTNNRMELMAAIKALEAIKSANNPLSDTVHYIFWICV
jgi:hypothetical protein